MSDAEELERSMPGEIELAGIIHDAADDGMGDHCSWSMANRAAEAIAKRLATVARGCAVSRPNCGGDK